LIQEDPHSAATIPSLTPVGFAFWTTLFILAYPEEEFRRLEKVILELPIDCDGDLVDGKPERLPKQISRHLFPEKEDRIMKKLLEKTILPLLKNAGLISHSQTSVRNFPNRRHSSQPHVVEIHQVRNPLISLRL
jgi:hypothetical protein